jgi:hypothetical protein
MKLFGSTATIALLTSASLTLTLFASAFSPQPSNQRCIQRRCISTLLSASDRRSFLSEAAVIASPFVLPGASNAASVPVQRAVGSGESRCREEGNCLETFEVRLLCKSSGWCFQVRLELTIKRFCS